MSVPANDASYLYDMLTYAQTVADVMRGLTREEYLLDRIRQLAVERAIEVIGESARKVSDACQQAHPEIPWRPIIAQRHVLAHDYGEVDHERLWRVATVHVTELIDQLRPLIPPLPGQGDKGAN